MSTFTPFLWLNGLARERDWLRERRDGLCEGLLWATNLSWNVRLGRWLMAWTRQASLSIVMPALFFVANTLGLSLIHI